MSRKYNPVLVGFIFLICIIGAGGLFTLSSSNKKNISQANHEDNPLKASMFIPSFNNNLANAFHTFGNLHLYYVNLVYSKQSKIVKEKKRGIIKNVDIVVINSQPYPDTNRVSSFLVKQISSSKKLLFTNWFYSPLFTTSNDIPIDIAIPYVQGSTVFVYAQNKELLWVGKFTE